MKTVDLIINKRDGRELSAAEIEFFIQGLTSGAIPDYQAAAWAMAVFFQGMTPREMTDLTLAMAHSGEMIDLRDTVPFAVDKHSTGGVGDKVTLVVEPTVAACGVPVGKMSGRGLGFSGGTIDKLESIPGLRLALSVPEFKRQLKEIGIVLTGQSGDLAPADGKLYALRDVTGTVPSIPLIASSVMSKKIAAGAQAIVLDVKMGTGAFMPDLDSATTLAQAMVKIGQHAGRKVVAVISDMNQPLGQTVGNALELREALETLRGGGPADFREHCLLIGGHLLVLAGKAATPKAARAVLQAAWDDGRALAKFRQMVAAQGGDVRVVDEPERLPRAAYIEMVPAPRTGYVAEIHAGEIGLTAVDLGAGRAKKGDALDYAAGLVIHHKVGGRVQRGEPLFTVHAGDPAKLAAAKARALAAHKFSRRPVEPLPLFYKVLKSR
ncbi:MAG: thymidine phosphorylase [Anaerolineales bacterium]|nr:thymidine phosphorylase [Anaerolineales bacterium]